MAEPLELVIQLLINGLHSKDEQAQILAAEDLARHGEAAVPLILAELDKLDANGKVSAVYALSLMGEKAIAATETLVRLLSDPDPALRNKAFDALVNIGEKAIPVLEQAQKRENSDTSRRIDLIRREINAPPGDRRLVAKPEGAQPQRGNVARPAKK